MVDTRVLALCAGVAGLELGVDLTTRGRTRVVAFCERDPFAASVLLARMEEQALEPAPVWCGDLADMPLEPFRGRVDLVTAGFPCQPWSAAGKRKGAEDERWIWPDIARTIRDVGPRYVFLENVRGLLSGDGIGRVLGSLAEIGFNAEWDVFSAKEVGAPHLRERVFILAYSHGKQRGATGGRSVSWADRRHNAGRGGTGNVANRSGKRRQQVSEGAHGDEAPDAGRREEHHLEGRGTEQSAGNRPATPNGTVVAWPPGPGDRASWATVLAERPDLAPAQPSVCGMADGIPDWLDRAMADRTDRLRALGNAVVPAQAAVAFRELAARISDSDDPDR